MPEAIAATTDTPPAAQPETRRAPGRGPLWALLAGGALLTGVAGLGGVAALAAVLAQPLFSLAIVQLRGRPLLAPRALQREGGCLALVWGAAFVLTLAVVAWPLSALLEGGSLLAALGLSLMVGVVLLGVWRLWPLWHGLASEGGTLRQHWQELGELDAGAWRGLLVAASVTAILAAIVLLAWPGLLGAARWPLAIALVLGAPGLHWLLQRVAPADALPEVDVPVSEAESDGNGELSLGGSVPLETELYAAARAGRVEHALQLIDAGADLHAPPPREDRDQRSLAVLAAVLPDLRLLRALIAHGVDLNVAHAGMTPLLAATRDSWHGRPDAVMTLLANGADPRAVDHEGNTALHHAARSSDPGVAALLRDAAADVDALNVDGLSPLGIACAAGNWRLAKFLLERGAKPEPAGGQPALLSAAGTEEDDAAGVQLLLKQKAKVDARDAHGRSALHEAAFAGHLEIVEALLNAGADPAAIDRLARTPVLEAARGGRLAVLDRLLAQLPSSSRGGGAATEAAAVDAHGRGALMLAAMSENSTPALIGRLLALGLDADARDFDDKRAIDRAAEAGRWALVAALDRAYPLPSAVSDAVEAGDATLPDRAPAALLRDGLHERRGAELGGLAQLLSAAELGALLHDEAPGPGVEQVERLLAWGADYGVRDANGDTPLFALLTRGPTALPALQALLRRGVSPAGSGGLARFLAACSASEQAARGLEYFALDLLERGADPFAPSPAGDPPLALAVRLGWSRLVDRLLAIGVSLDGRDSHGMSALHLAAALGREAMLKQLVAYGAAPDVLAADGQTPLGVALSSGRRDLADWLDWRGWPLPRRPLRATDVPAAAIVGDADAVRRLLDLGLPVDAADNQGCSALLRAAGGGHRAVVDLLLARGADPQLAANSGATPLSAAVSMRHVEVVDRLIAAGVSLEQRLPGDLTVLMVACALGLPDMAARLLSAGANVHAADAQGRSALHCAAMFGFTARERARLVALLDTLLLAGAEADLPTAGATPLLLLLGARAEPGSAADEDVLMAGLDQLLDHDARLDAQEPRGFGPLHLAALHGLMRVAQKLLRAGADPSQRDTLNRTPREIAVMRGFVDIAAELAPTPVASGQDVSMARFLRDR